MSEPNNRCEIAKLALDMYVQGVASRTINSVTQINIEAENIFPLYLHIAEKIYETKVKYVLDGTF